MAVKGMSVFTQNGEDFTINDPNIANEFSASAAYAAGDHIYYQGNLYRFTVAHAAGAWTGSDVTLVKLGQEVSDLKSALNTKINGDGKYMIPYTWEQGAISSTDGDVPDNTRLRTVGYYATNGCSYIDIQPNWYVWIHYYDSSYSHVAGGTAWTTGKIYPDTTYPYYRLAFKNYDSRMIMTPSYGINAQQANETDVSEIVGFKNSIVRTDTTQNFTDAQKKTGRDNIGSASENDINSLVSFDDSIFHKKDSPVLFIGNFVNGDLSGNGIDTTVKKRIVNENIIDIAEGIYIYAKSGFAFYVAYYDSEGTRTSISSLVDALNVKTGSRIRVCVRRTTESSSEVANIIEFGSGVVYDAELNRLIHDAESIIGIDKYGKYSYHPQLEQGTLSSGAEASDNTRCRSGFIDFGGYGIVAINAESGYSFIAYKYSNGEYTALSSWTANISIVPEKNILYRIIARNNNNSRVYPLTLSQYFTIELTGKGQDQIDAFVVDLAERKSTEAMADAVTENSSFICMPWISDNHVSPSSAKVTKDTVDCLRLVSEKLPVDFICHTGDIIDKPYIDGGGTSAGVCNLVNDYLYGLNNIKTLLLTNGNHDGIDANTYYAWRFYYYMNGKINADITERPTDCAYFYKDIPINKLRLIFLSCPDDPNYYGWNTNQLYWLINSALDTPENFKVMFFCHVPTVWTSSIGGSPMNNKAALETIITAYSEGTSGTVTLLDETVLEYSFSTGKTVVAYLCGHTHRDTVVDVGETVPGGQTNGLPCKQIVIGASKFVVESGGGSVGGSSPSRTMGTDSEILFDVIMYYPLKQKINLIRCGAGSSRSVSVN